MGYTDDSHLQGPSFDDCSNNVQDTVYPLTKVGFLLNQSLTSKHWVELILWNVVRLHVKFGPGASREISG